MKYYHQPENRIITTEELVAKYGTEKPVKQLGIHCLSKQPDYVPVSYNELPDGTWYPVESYTGMQVKAVQALVDAGYTREEAAEMLD